MNTMQYHCPICCNIPCDCTAAENPYRKGLNKNDYRYVRWEADTRNAAFWRNRLYQCPEGEAFDELRMLYREMAEEREGWALEYWVAMANDGGNDA